MRPEDWHQFLLGASLRRLGAGSRRQSDRDVIERAILLVEQALKRDRQPSPNAGSATQLHLLLKPPSDAHKVERSHEEANAQDECEHKQHDDPCALV